MIAQTTVFGNCGRLGIDPATATESSSGADSGSYLDGVRLVG